MSGLTHYLVGMVRVAKRKLPAAAREERRRQVAGLRESGLTFAVLAAQMGLTENGASGICRRYAERGMAALASRPRGLAPGTGRFLSVKQETEMQALICRHLADALGLHGAEGSVRFRASKKGSITKCGVPPIAGEQPYWPHLTSGRGDFQATPHLLMLPRR